MTDLIKEKKEKIEKLKLEIRTLEDDIETLELQERYGVILNAWYKNRDNTMFFRPTSIYNNSAVGFSITIDKHELAYNVHDDTVSLEYCFSNMQVSSYDEMLNAVNVHNLKVLNNYK